MEKKKNLLNLQNLCAAGLILFFFFPWINIMGFVSISGYQIPDIVKGLGQVGMMLDETNKSIDPRVYLYYLVYLIPLFSLLTIIFSFMGRSAKLFALIASIIPIGGFIVLLFNMGVDVFNLMGIGMWLTLLTAIVMLLAVLNILKLPGLEQDES